MNSFPDDIEPADIADPGMLPAKVEYLHEYLGWRATIVETGADPLAEMCAMLEDALWNTYHAGGLPLDTVHDEIARARALLYAAEDLARE